MPGRGSRLSCGYRPRTASCSSCTRPSSQMTSVFTSHAAAFTPRRVEGLRPAVDRIVMDLLDALGQQQDTDFIAAFAFPLPVAVIGELLGVPASDWPMFQALSRNWVTVLEDLTPAAVDHADPAATAIGDYDPPREQSRQPQNVTY